MSCGTKTVKIAYIIFSVVLAILGILFITEAILIRNDLSLGAASVAYIAGPLMVLLAVLGCFAAKRESISLMATCAAFLLILTIIHIVLSCLNVYEKNVRWGVSAVNSAWDDNEMDALQQEYECCGKTSPQDYILLNKVIPVSCYADHQSTNLQALYTVGCTAKLQEYYDKRSPDFAIFFWVLVAFEISGFFLAILLIVNLRNKQRRMQF